MADDTLVVTARTRRQWVNYWYDGAGRLQERLELAHAGRLGDESGLVIRDLLPLVSQRRLLVFVDAREDEGGGDGGDVPGVRLYDVASRSVLASYGLPDPGPRRRGPGGVTAAGGTQLARPVYHPLGVTADGLLFLTRREDDRTRSLLVLGRGGRVVVRRHWVLDETGLGYVSLGMSHSGVLYGLLGAATGPGWCGGAATFWWRSRRRRLTPMHDAMAGETMNGELRTVEAGSAAWRRLRPLAVVTGAQMAAIDRRAQSDWSLPAAS